VKGEGPEVVVDGDVAEENRSIHPVPCVPPVNPVSTPISASAMQ
jgi:hypothetical protein